jgi:hypothetical protein
MTHLVHFSHPEWMHDNVLMLDVVERAYRNKDVVKILVCDSTIKICSANLKSEKIICTWCKYYRKKLFGDISKDIEVLKYGQFYSNNKNAVDVLKFEYNSISDIKNLTYQNVRIGFGALSSYVSITRNLYPKINDAFRKYFDLYLKAEIILIEVLNNVLNKIHPDLVSVYNGRFFETRPVFEFYRNWGCNVRCYENIKTTKFTNRSMVFFDNALPQNLKQIGEMINTVWKNTKISEEEKERIGTLFFLNRKNAIFAGDTVYTQKQRKGLLPERLDESKRNIAIFISSEDEYYAVDDEYEKKMFDSQYDGIASILKYFINKKEFHFYLRIHPNLKNVKYKYHTLLSGLEQLYSNVTVISANAEISSYALLDGTEKSIVFGSTMGVEACFWRKPVILLSSASYQNLDVCYKPEKLEDAVSLIQAVNLQARNQKDAMKYGFYFMFDRGEKPLRFDFNMQFIYFKFLNKKILLVKHQPVKYSLFVLFLVRTFLYFLSKTSLYKPIKIPLDED